MNGYSYMASFHMSGSSNDSVSYNSFAPFVSYSYSRLRDAS